MHNMMNNKNLNVYYRERSEKLIGFVLVLFLYSDARMLIGDIQNGIPLTK